MIWFEKITKRFRVCKLVFLGRIHYICVALICINYKNHMKKPVLFLASLAVLTFGCGHTYYVPNLQNIPLFRQEGDNMFVISSGSGIGDALTMFDVQGAYAITNHFAVTGAYFSTEEEGGNEPGTDYSKGSMFEVGAGIYQPLGKIGSFDFFGGYGNGDQFHQYNTSSWDYTGMGLGNETVETGIAALRYNRFFARSSIGLTTKIIDLAFSARLSNMRYYDVQSSIDGEGDEFNTLSRLSGLSCWWFEPAVTLRLGYSPVKLQLQVALSRQLQEINPVSTPLSVNLGLVFVIPQSKNP